MKRVATLLAALLLSGGSALAYSPTFDNNNVASEALYNSNVLPHDWTGGTGTLGATGQIAIPAPATGKRQWFFVQNQSTSIVTVEYQALLANGTSPSTINVVLAPASAAGGQGSSDERGFSAFVPQGSITVVGAANAQVAVAEVIQ